MLKSKLHRFSKSQLFALIVFLALLSFPFLLTSSDLLHPKSSQPIYLTIKLNQGYWWLNNPNPPLTLIEAIKPQLTAYDFLGHPTAKIIAKHVYPTFSTNTERPVYNTYVDLVIYKAKTSKNEIFFNRQRVAIGEPLEVKFPHLTLSGSIINLSTTKPARRLQTYQITLQRLVYPWEYQQLQLPTSYFDGQTQVFKITHRQCLPAIIVTRDKYNQILKKTNQNTCYLTLQGTISLENHQSTLTFGPEIPIAQGAPVFLPLQRTYLIDFTVTQLRPLKQNSPQPEK